MVRKAVELICFFQLLLSTIAKTNDLTNAINENKQASDQQMQGLHEKITEIKGKFF